MFQQIKNLGKHTFIYAIGSAIQTLVGFILVPIYTHFLSPAEYGQLEILNTILLILTMLLSFGFASAILKVHERDCPTEEEKKKAIGTMYFFVIPLATIFSLLAFLFIKSLARLTLGNIEYANLILLTLVTNIITIFLALSFAVLRTKEKSISYVLLSLLKFILILIFNIYFVTKLNLGIFGILSGNLIAQVISSVIFLPSVAKYAKFVISKRLLSKLLSFGMAIIPASIAMWIMDLSDRYFLKHFSDFTEVGLYSLGYKVGMVISVLLVVPFQLSWPTISFALAKRADVRKIYSKVLTYFFLISSFLALGVSLFSSQIVKLLAPESFYSAARVIPLISFSYVFYGIHFVISPGLHLMEKTKYYPLLVGIPAVLNLILNYYFVPIYGIMGAAMTTFVCFVFMVILTYFVSNHFYPVKYEWSRLLKITFVLILALILSYLIQSPTGPVGGSTLQKSLAPLLILFGFPCILCLLRFFEKKELNSVKKLFSQLYSN
jgi:O-antigen/teichoic acid export membrane protein